MTEKGEAIGAAWNIAREGHEVLFFTQTPLHARTGEGIFHKVESWRPYINKVDFVICDGTSFSEYEELLQPRVRLLLGGSKLSVLMGGKKRPDFLEKCGIRLCSNNEHIVAVHGLFNGRGWVEPLFVSLGEYFLFPGGLGPAVKSMGCVVKALKSDVPFKEEIEFGLRKLGVKDFVTIIYSFDDEGLGCQGVFAGLDGGVIDALAEGSKADFTDLLFETAAGILKENRMTSDVIISVRLSCPPWPYSSAPNLNKGPIIEGIDENNLPHLHMYGVLKDEEGYWVSLGTGNVLNVTARGRDIREAQRRVYRTLSNLQLPEKQYRLDIGNNAEKDLRSWTQRGLLKNVL